MKRFLYISSCLLLISCQIEEDGTPTPEEGFIKFFGEGTTYSTYESSDLESVGDTMIVFGSAFNLATQNSDLSIMLLTSEGAFLDSVQYAYNQTVKVDSDGDNFLDTPVDITGDEEIDEIEGNAIPGQIEPIMSGPLSGGFVAVGTYLFNNSSLQISNINTPFIAIYNASLELVTDEVVILPNGSFSAQEQLLNAFGEDFIQLSDGNFLFGESVEIDRGGGSTDFDFRLTKYSLNASSEGPPFTTIWQETIGIRGPDQDEFLSRIFEKENGNLVLIGSSSEESSLGENGGDNGTNVTYVELTSEGKVINGISYGLDYTSPGGTDSRENVVFNEVVNAAIQTPSGFAIVGTSTLSTEDNYAFFMNLTNVGSFIAGDTLASSLDGSFETRGLGIAQAGDNDYVVFGEYENFIDAENRRAGEALLMKISQSGDLEDEVNYGSIDGNDRAVDGLLAADNKIIVLANIDFGGGVELVSLIKTNDNGEIED